MSDERSMPWLVSVRFDLAVFGGSAALAAALLAAGGWTGALSRPLSPWTWVATVLAVDVAHVWATLWRVYLDPEELRRRPQLYLSIPLVGYVAGVLLHSVSAAFFWRALAYLAVYHFVRQQAGWVALYHRRAGSSSTRLDRTLDAAAVYAGTLYPLVWWHAHLPREFEWFLAGDFIPGLPAALARLLLAPALVIAVLWLARQAWLLSRGRAAGAGKAIVITTTWLAWWGGIVAFDSDYAFTVTNTLLHGAPYLAFVWAWGRRRHGGARSLAGQTFAGRALRSIPVFLAPLLLLAFLEEWAWDRSVWHERPALFPGAALDFGPAALGLLVPLLAVPQLTHYLLDGFIWRTGAANPSVARAFALGAVAAAPGSARESAPHAGAR